MTQGDSKKKVFVGLSGGVDSAVSAALLQEAGYDVTGVFMKNWSGDDFGIQADCPWEVDQADAKAVADHLGIEFRSFNFEKQYREQVVEYFFSEYKKGRTPNPDVMCNKEIKFKLFLEKALAEGADYIATGHYARKAYVSDANQILLNRKNKWQQPEQADCKLLKGVDKNKNQTYFLYNITSDQLSNTIFPVGEFEKSEVRKLAKEFNLPNAEKPDSQGICFIGKINVLKFLMSEIPKKTGDVIDIETGEKVDTHDGIYFYTIGQRAKISGQVEPYFYCGKDLDKNIMYVCQGKDNQELYKDEVKLENIHWISNEPKDLDNLQAAIRYRQEPSNGNLNIKNLTFKFEKPQRAIASGQSLVIYQNDVCIGGGIISK